MNTRKRSSAVPRSARVLAAALGALFLVLGSIVLITAAPLTWKPLLAAVVLLIIALDFLFSATRNRWPILVPALFLP